MGSLIPTIVYPMVPLSLGRQRDPGPALAGRQGYPGCTHSSSCPVSSLHPLRGPQTDLGAPRLLRPSLHWAPGADTVSPDCAAPTVACPPSALTRMVTSWWPPTRGRSRPGLQKLCPPRSSRTAVAGGRTGPLCEARGSEAAFGGGGDKERGREGDRAGTLSVSSPESAGPAGGQCQDWEATNQTCPPVWTGRHKPDRGALWRAGQRASRFLGHVRAQGALGQLTRVQAL